MIAIMRRDFSEHHQMQVAINENKLGTLGMMSQNAEQIGIDYPESPHSSYVAQTAEDFLFLSEEEGSAENAITIEEDEEFSEPWTPVIKPPRQPPAMEARPALRSNRNFKISRTQLLDGSLICI